MDEHSKNVVLRWWQSMALPESALQSLGVRPAPSAFKARLKRCQSTDAVVLTDGFRALWLQLDEAMTAQAKGSTLECWATIAAVLAYVKNDGADNLATAAGKIVDSDKSRVSELRFAQLQNAKTPADFFRRLRRVVQQLSGDVNVKTLAANIHQWFNEHYQFRPVPADKRIAVIWAMDYYRAAAAAAKK